jgi:hypothetical protein
MFLQDGEEMGRVGSVGGLRSECQKEEVQTRVDGPREESEGQREGSSSCCEVMALPQWMVLHLGLTTVMLLLLTHLVLMGVL